MREMKRVSNIDFTYDLYQDGAFLKQITLDYPWQVQRLQKQISEHNSKQQREQAQRDRAAAPQTSGRKIEFVSRKQWLQGR